VPSVAGGPTAPIDCDRPPSSGEVAADEAWALSRKIVRLHETRLARGVRSWSKDARVEAAAARARRGRTRPLVFTYRVRIGVTA